MCRGAEGRTGVVLADGPHRIVLMDGTAAESWLGLGLDGRPWYFMPQAEGHAPLSDAAGEPYTASAIVEGVDRLTAELRDWLVGLGVAAR